MPLPSTNLTAHFDASDTDNIFTTVGNPPSGTPVDGSAVQEWEDDDGKDLSLQFGETGAEANWRSSTPLLDLPCLDFDGTNDWYNLWNNAGTIGPKAIGDVVSNTDYVILAAIHVENITTNDATIENNEALLSDDASAVFGIFLKNNAGACTLNIYNWDGTADIVALTMSLNTDYVLVAWHTGGNLFGELYSSTGLDDSDTVASGTTTGVAGALRVGRCRDAISQKYNGRIGELAFYNAHNATDRGNATTYFRQRWLGLAVTGGTFALHG